MVFLPAWTPGSYLIREYARHLGQFRVTASDGGPMRWHKTGKNRFRIEPDLDESSVRISYTVYAHELSVRTADLTDQHAFLCGAAGFLWPVGVTQCETSIELLVPEDWDVATSLPHEVVEPGRIHLRATGLDELVDSPILAGLLEKLEFTALHKPHTLVLDGLCGVTAPDTLVEDTIRIIEQAAAIYGDTLPYDRYEFLCMFTDSGRGGLEHLASSALLAPRTTFHKKSEYREFIGLVAHEFFHVWNFKRMRPAELWEFDYENENYTELLWVAEGFTTYYDDHLCRRAGVLTPTQYLEGIAHTIAELRRTPGRFRQSLSEASFDAWILLYRPDENTHNSTLSYYGNGALAALCLDLRIRQETGGKKSLDDAVRLLYERTYLAGRGYTYEDVVDVLEETARTDVSGFLHALVRQPLDPDFDAVFKPFGLTLSEKQKDGAYLGVHFKSGTTTLSSVLHDSPADLAGLMPGDEVLALDGLRVTSASWSRVFDSVTAVQQPVEVLVSRRGRVLTVSTVPGPRPAASLSVDVREDSTPEQDRLRRAWLFDDSV